MREIHGNVAIARPCGLCQSGCETSHDSLSMRVNGTNVCSAFCATGTCHGYTDDAEAWSGAPQLRTGSLESDVVLSCAGTRRTGSRVRHPVMRCLTQRIALLCAGKDLTHRDSSSEGVIKLDIRDRPCQSNSVGADSWHIVTVLGQSTSIWRKWSDLPPARNTFGDQCLDGLVERLRVHLNPQPENSSQ